VLERHPDLDVVLAHGGGTLPFLSGRLDHTYAVRDEVKAALRRPPSAYLKRFYADTITHHDGALAFLIEGAGAGRVLLGTDLPYDMADPDPAARLRRLRLPPADAAIIESGNAVRLLRLDT